MAIVRHIKHKKPLQIRDPYNVIRYPYVTEKTMNLIEINNSLSFIVGNKATKDVIKLAVEKLFECKVKSVNTMRTKHGKMAIVTLMPEYSASDLGMRIGIF